MKNRVKYNLDIFDEALRIIHDGLFDKFSCNAIRKAVENLGGMQFYKSDKDNCPELKLFQEMFDGFVFFTFNSQYKAIYGIRAEHEELKQIRLMALALAREIARLHNNKKASL